MNIVTGPIHSATQRSGSLRKQPVEPSQNPTYMEKKEKNGSTLIEYQRIRIMVFADMNVKKDSASGLGLKE